MGDLQENTWVGEGDLVFSLLSHYLSMALGGNLLLDVSSLKHQSPWILRSFSTNWHCTWELLVISFMSNSSLHHYHLLTVFHTFQNIVHWWLSTVCCDWPSVWPVATSARVPNLQIWLSEGILQTMGLARAKAQLSVLNTMYAFPDIPRSAETTRKLHGPLLCASPFRKRLKLG